jgi:septum formation inhibitor-activating ATPase MinD
MRKSVAEVIAGSRISRGGPYYVSLRHVDVGCTFGGYVAGSKGRIVLSLVKILHQQCHRGRLVIRKVDFAVIRLFAAKLDRPREELCACAHDHLVDIVDVVAAGDDQIRIVASLIAAVI